MSQDALSLLDWALALGLVLSVMVGVVRGLLKEVLSLLGWGVGYFSAQWWGRDVAQLLPIGLSGSALNVMAGMVVVFLGTWLVWSVLIWALHEVLSATGLGGVDRLLGGFFGLCRGVLVALLCYTLLSMTPMTQWSQWQSSQSLPWLHTLLMGLRPVLPERMLEYLPETHARQTEVGATGIHVRTR